MNRKTTRKQQLLLSKLNTENIMERVSFLNKTKSKIPKLILICFLLIQFQMCSSTKNEKNAIEFNDEIENIVEKYKKELKTESIRILPFLANENDTLDYIQIVVIEPDGLSENEILNVSKEVAKDVYGCLINKNDFLGITVEFVFTEQYFGELDHKFVSDFTFSELENN